MLHRPAGPQLPEFTCRSPPVAFTGIAAPALSPFSAPVRAWFEASFPAPTDAQAGAWPAIAAGEHALVLAPTGSGKTLAAFLWGIDRLLTTPPPEDRTHRTRLLYVSPLRALAVDVDKNLRAPLAGVALAAERLGVTVHTPVVGMRTGDTPADERRRLVRRPPDILITTPESLYLMLTSAARETLAGVEAVIVDEIHAVAATKRGSHLALTLERLEQRCDKPPQRIGLSATQLPLEEIARFLGGYDAAGAPRPVSVVDAGSAKSLEVSVVVPVEDLGDLGSARADGGPAAGAQAGPAGASGAQRSIWPAMHPRLLELVEANRSTLIFVNARRLAERLATRLNELAAERAAPEFTGGEQVGRPPTGVELVRAHHGSLSRERRLVIEDELKAGTLRGLVATSSLELGIDMGAVDLVVQVESPGAVSRGLQRIGRAGHQVGEPSRGVLFPKHRADLLEAAVVVQRMKAGLIEATRYPRNPLDVLAQQIVAMVALDDWAVADLAALVRQAAPFHGLSDEVLTAVLDLLSGRYPSEEFAELRPRIVWDRAAGVVRARAGAQRLAVTNAGTIPDRGLFGVFLPDGTRVGELDEEMVYESRPGETFLLGASTWQITDITPDRVVVVPAPGRVGRMPFWHGDGPGRPLELGRAVGAFVRELRALPEAAARERLTGQHGLDEWAAANLLGFLAEQAEATGAVPDDRTIVVERFRDEIGDWRVCVLSPFGARVHAPWAMALRHRLTERWGVDPEMIWSDDGIVIRLPEAVEDLPVDELAIAPEEVRDLLLAHLPGTAMFASRFRQCAARALLLPRRRPDRRTPLWQQRQRAADLLGVAARHPSFPILLETLRECLDDVFDLPALTGLLRDLRSRAVRVVGVETASASPFAQSLLFGWIAVYMYEGDAPLAERRAAALALDRGLLAELLGAEELRELLDPAVLAEVEAELQRLAGPRFPARDADEAHDLLRELGPLAPQALAARCTEGADVTGWVAELTSARRAIRVHVAGEERVADAADAARLRDALGAAIPVGLPTAFTDPVDDPLGALVGRYARTHGPFHTRDVAVHLGVEAVRVVGALDRLEAAGRLVQGEFRPEGTEREWCDVDVLRRLRRRSLAALRHQVEPVDAEAFARFLPAWHGVGSVRTGVDGLVDALGPLQGVALPASVLEADVLPARLASYGPGDLDALGAAGELVWVGAGALGQRDGRVRFAFRDQLALLFDEPAAGGSPAGPAVGGDPAQAGGADVGRGADAGDTVSSPVHEALRAHLAERGASFWPELLGAVAAAGEPADSPSVLAALWDLVWAGEITNDTFGALRAHLAGHGARASRGRSRGSGRRGVGARPGRLGRVGPPAAAGRWSLVAAYRSEAAATDTELAHARAVQLLERHGVLTREAVLAEGVPGGFAGVYPVLRALEERGQVRRGWFVAGLGAAQFALPGAVDRLRSFRADLRPEPSAIGGADEAAAGALVLAATDPAQPFGAALGWPAPAATDAARPSRSAGAHVVLHDGELLAFLERGGRTLTTFPAALSPEAAELLAAALADLVRRGRYGTLEIARIDGGPAREAGLAEALRAAGFVDGYRGLVLRHRHGA